MIKFLKITGIVLLVLLILVGGFLIFWFFGDKYDEFYKSSKKEFEIAGLDDGFTPQGICYSSSDNIFLTSGYMKDGGASRIYVVNKTTQETIKYFTLKKNGEDYNGHAGGIATNGVNVWVAGDKIVHTFSYADIANVQDKGFINITASFEPKNGADFLTVKNNQLWIGEFHKSGAYDTDQTHEITTASGDKNQAISFCFNIDNTTLGFNTTPVKALSTPSQVQGMVITNDSIVLSTSYSLPASHIYKYENVLNSTTDKTFDYSGNNIPLYVLDKANIEKDLVTPSMSEEIEIVDGRIYILFENACQKYRLFTREKLTNVYSIEL